MSLISCFNHRVSKFDSSLIHFSGAERKFSLNKPGLDRNKSAFELSSKATDNEESANALRKASSVSNYNLETHDHLPRQNSSSLLSSAFHFVTGNSNASPLAVQKISEDDEGGLKMMVSSGSSFSSGALTSSRVLHADPIVHNNPSTHLADVGSLTERNEVRLSGRVFNTLNFSANPAECSAYSTKDSSQSPFLTIERTLTDIFLRLINFKSSYQHDSLFTTSNGSITYSIAFEVFKSSSCGYPNLKDFFPPPPNTSFFNSVLFCCIY